MIVYIIRNRINGLAYVGQTRRTLRQRWTHHKHNASKNSLLRIHRAIAEYGPDNFELSVLDSTAKTIQELNELERKYIVQMNSLHPHGYNLVSGGTNGMRTGGWKHTEATKRRMSECAKGRVFSEEHRANLSIAHQGKRQPLSVETIEKIRAKKIARDVESPKPSHVRWHVKRGIVNPDCILCRTGETHG